MWNESSKVDDELLGLFCSSERVFQGNVALPRGKTNREVGRDGEVAELAHYDGLVETLRLTRSKTKRFESIGKRNEMEWLFSGPW